MQQPCTFRLHVFRDPTDDLSIVDTAQIHQQGYMLDTWHSFGLVLSGLSPVGRTEILYDSTQNHYRFVEICNSQVKIIGQNIWLTK